MKITALYLLGALLVTGPLAAWAITGLIGFGNPYTILITMGFGAWAIVKAEDIRRPTYVYEG